MTRCPATWILPLVAAAIGVSCQEASHPSRQRQGAAPESGNHRVASTPFLAQPRELWSRELGPGYSGIVAQNDRIYTMYRAGDEEVVVSLAAASGETVWEHRYISTPLAGQDTGYGTGPNAAPLLADGRLYTVGFTGFLQSHDADTGEVLWSHDLWGELGGNVVELGYSSTPVAYRGSIIVLVGGKGRALVAFDREDGRVLWKKLDFENSYASPVIMKLHGDDQLVAFMTTEIVGASPRDGKLLWLYPIRNHYPQNICAPIQIDDDVMFVSTTEAGSRGLKVVDDAPFRIEALWSTRKVQCFYGTFARIGGTLYGTSGVQSSPRMSALDAKSGEVAWRLRGFNLSHVVAVGSHLMLLDDEGTLTLAAPTPEGLDVFSETRILSPPSRTPPTLMGSVLYARDQRRIVAFEVMNPGS